MDIRFTGKDLKITEGMKEHLLGKLPKLEKYAPRLVEAHVFLKKEKYLFQAEVTLLAKNLRADGEGKAKENIFAAMDEAYTRVEKQLKKFRAKTKDHHKKEGKQSSKVTKAFEMIESEASLEGTKPKIIHASAVAPKPMSPEEASLQLELSKESFLVFLNSTTNQINVIRKRKDGNHELIEPEF